jgi:hypothetical protein
MRSGAVSESTTDQLVALGTLLGRSGKVIESQVIGNSMGSSLPSGSRIRIRRLAMEDYSAGQVVAFVAGGKLYGHRIVYRSSHGFLTRGDNHAWCDLPVHASSILGVIEEIVVDEKNTPIPNESVIPRARFEILLRACIKVDIRLAQHVVRVLMLFARWRRVVMANLFHSTKSTK